MSSDLYSSSAKVSATRPPTNASHAPLRAASPTPPLVPRTGSVSCNPNRVHSSPLISSSSYSDNQRRNLIDKSLERRSSHRERPHQNSHRYTEIERNTTKNTKPHLFYHVAHIPN
ncbi:hypothetical protein Rs2_21911 [Raphanus sativus]|nr:hypothetical protein Rs2_21911 [Raphanus sativus]